MGTYICFMTLLNKYLLEITFGLAYVEKNDSTQLAIIYSKLTIKTACVVLVSLLLTLNIFHTFF